MADLAPARIGDGSKHALFDDIALDLGGPQFHWFTQDEVRFVSRMF